MNLWHNPAMITNSSIATAFATLLPNSNFPTSTVAGVINTFPSGRQQVSDSFMMRLMLTDPDGFFHWIWNRLELDFKSVDTCMDPLGYERVV
jgi:hypothetical protein